MKYQLLKCKSEVCKDAYPELSCGWSRKVLTCSVTRKMAICDILSEAGSTRQQKDYCQELTAQRMIPNALRVKFGLEGVRLPLSRAVQNVVNYYSKTHLGYNDLHDDITQVVRKKADYEGKDECIPISFTYGKTSDGHLVVGYTVLVMGISDRARKFHLAEFSILSQRLETAYTMTLLSFHTIYTGVSGKPIRLMFCDGDAEDSQLNALELVSDTIRTYRS
ncbi:hypothetical protein GQ600_19885 [Phytophthora cactorum]|nr:hypothetical protein GQ600_19885 [Phytophthora cactorum]